MDGPAPEHVTLDEALDIIRDLLREQFRLTGRLPKTVVTIGGTALAARGIRERSDDVDLYLSETEDASVLSVQDAYRRKYGPTFKIDVTPVNTLWGDIAVNDIEQSPIVATLEVQGRTVEIRALSPETMYLVKVAAYRPKDIPDLPLIATRCSSQSLIVRAKQMFPWYADRSAFPQYVERLARCIAQHFTMRLEAVDAEFGLSDAVSSRVMAIRAGLQVQFMAMARAAMVRRSDLIEVDPHDSMRMVFDAAAAGAPQEVIETVAHHPRETSDMAISVLKAADPKRHAAWLGTLARSRKSSAAEGRKTSLAKKIVDAAAARGFDLPGNAEEKLGIYADEPSLQAMASEIETATSFQAILDAHSITLPSDDHD
jgi:hypothetical protein